MQKSSIFSCSFGICCCCHLPKETFQLVHITTHRSSEAAHLLQLICDQLCTYWRTNISFRDSSQVSIISLHRDEWKRGARETSQHAAVCGVVVRSGTDVDLSFLLCFSVGFLCKARECCSFMCLSS